MKGFDSVKARSSWLALPPKHLHGACGMMLKLLFCLFSMFVVQTLMTALIQIP